MVYLLLADLLLILHLAFILFVALGGLFVLRRPRILWLHLPVVAWGTLSELFGIICPLTPLETALRELGGGTGYEGGFIEHYITAIIYPDGLTRRTQIALAGVALVLNTAIYGYCLLRKRKSRRRS